METDPTAKEQTELSDHEMIHNKFNDIKRDDPSVPPKTFSMGEAMGHSMLCNFCRKEYSGKPVSCPHCHKKFPVIPDMLHIV